MRSLTRTDFEFLLAAAKSEYAPWIETGVINGLNLAVGTTPEDVADQGGAWAGGDVALALEVVSGSANDTAAGTGARTLLLSGIGAAGQAQTEALALNGTTPVASALTWLHVHQALCTTFGAGMANAGAVTVRIAAAGATIAQVSAGRGVSQSSIYRVPAGRTFFVGTFFLNTRNGTNSVEWRFCARLPGSGGWIVPATFYSGDNATPVEFRPRPVGGSFPAGTLLKWQAAVNAGSVECSTGMAFSLVDDAHALAQTLL